MKRRDTDVNLLMQLDVICEEYESQFREGKEPRVEDFLDRVQQEHCSELIHELVKLEVSLRSDQGESVSADEFVDRYARFLPDHAGREALRSTIEQALDSTANNQQPLRSVTGPMQREPIARPAEPALPSIEGFEIESVLGRGGMGIVYRAVQTSLNRPVALKMTLEHVPASDEYLGRFKNEAESYAELNDPHFVQIYEFGRTEGRPYMALEFVEGGSLEQYRQGEPQPVEFAARLVETLARTMHKAHLVKLVHRDLKPHNVLLTLDGMPKITDFGLVKRQNQETQMTEHGRVMGTASYMAPEQSRGVKEVGPPADIHALGAILYCLLTGRPPFLAGTVYDTIRQVRDQAPVAPSRLRPDVPVDLETICLKSLEKEPDRRYASAADLAADLRRYLEGRPIVARPVSVPERAWRWAKRNPWVSGLGTSVAALLVAISVVTSVSSYLVSDANAQLSNIIEELEDTNVQLDDSNKKLEDTNVQLEDTNNQLKETNTDLEETNQQLVIKTEEAETAKEAAETQRDIAQEQFVLSMDAIRSVVFVMARSMRNNHAEVELRKRLIDLALSNLEHLRKNFEKNPLGDRNEATGRQQLGDIYFEVGQIQQALKQYERAYEITNKLVQRDPRDPVYTRNLAGITNSLGDVHKRLGNTLKSREHYRQGLQLRQRWVELRPELDEAKHAVAQSYVLLGKVNLTLGDPAAAMKRFDEARTQFRKLPGDFLQKTSVYRELADLQQRLGESHYQLGSGDEAMQLLSEALGKRKRVAEQAGDDITARALGISRLALGDFYLCGQQDPHKAWDEYEQVRREFQKLWEAQPDLAQTRTDLAAIHYRLGGTLDRARQMEVKIEAAQDGDARKYFEKSCELREGLAQIDPADMQSKIEWALALARCGRFTKAESVADELAEKGKGDPRLLSQAAFTFALCSDADDEKLAARCRKKALETLKRCIAAGWKDWVALRDDPDLDPIRRDPEFLQLQDSLQSSAPGQEAADDSP